MRRHVERLREQALQLGGGHTFERAERAAERVYLRVLVGERRRPRLGRCEQGVGQWHTTGHARDRLGHPLPYRALRFGAGDDADHLRLLALGLLSLARPHEQVRHDPTVLDEGRVPKHVVEERRRGLDPGRQEAPHEGPEGTSADPRDVVEPKPLGLGEGGTRDEGHPEAG